MAETPIVEQVAARLCDESHHGPEGEPCRDCKDRARRIVALVGEHTERLEAEVKRLQAELHDAWDAMPRCSRRIPLKYPGIHAVCHRHVTHDGECSEFGDPHGPWGIAREVSR